MKTPTHYRDAQGAEWRLHAFGLLPDIYAEVALVVVDEDEHARIVEHVGFGSVRELSGRAALGAVRWVPLIKGGDIFVATRSA